MADVVLPRTLVELFPGAPRRLEVQAPSVGAVIDRLDATYPGMRNRLLDAGPQIRRHLMVYVDQERAGLETPVASGSEVRIIAAVSGG
jgi:molybdopterin synthase sulfur carrier subunit